MIKFCKSKKINEIYLQIYRAGETFYDSKIADRKRYEVILNSAGLDTVDFLLTEAHKNNIKVLAWINVLSLARNKSADILMKFGEGVLTRDQYLRTSIRSEEMNESDKYYLRDDQLFLEPGDSRVVDYIVALIREIITRYPQLDGIHLDYIRYPYIIPFVPDSRFIDYGIMYGYGEKNILRFKEKTGLDPLKIKEKKDAWLKWDDWKREQITNLVRKISDCIKKYAPSLTLSCAVIPSWERAYNNAFQDWSLWLEQGIVDYVVLMNYTRDNRLAKEIALSVLAHKGKIYVGIGAFLMRDEPEVFWQQYKIIKNLKPDGIVFFSYDDYFYLMK